MATWNCFSNHGQVLLVLAHAPNLRLRDLADRIGLTERAVHRLVHDLVEFGVITRHRRGRRMHYTVRRDSPLSHPLPTEGDGEEPRDHTVGDLIDLLRASASVDEESDRHSA